MQEPVRRPGAPAAGFRLMRYFTLTTLVAFAAVAVSLFFLQRMEEDFFAQVQKEQAAFFAEAQDELARQHQEAARSSLLAVHEASHVNLTRMVANMLWASDFAPFLAAAQRFPIDACKALKGQPLPVRRACWGEIGRRIVALPAFKSLDAKAYAAMQNTSVFKIKVFDLRGVTFYSSEHAQIGEFAGENAGWRAASQGSPASELTHRDRFSAFERVVENRDLISTYVPVRAGGSDEVLGVVELYSDVTPFLEQTKAASRKFAQISTVNQARIEAAARANQHKVERSSHEFLVIVGGLLLLLYATSLLIVRIGQRIIDRQAREQAEAAEREQRWHREKMATLATMAANVAHEVGNPLAVIHLLAAELPESQRDASREIQTQSLRIARMMRQIADFATARSEAAEWVDVSAMVKAVCEFLSFDWRFRGKPIEFRAGQDVPACELVPDHLNEVTMNLLQACAEEGAPLRRCDTFEVSTFVRQGRVVVNIGGRAQAGGEIPAALSTWLAQSRFEPIRRRVAEMGARLGSQGQVIEIELPQAVSEKGH
jgi:signal transduction histidine kinase